ncbi:MAG TPA: hypothetical protein VG275_07975 [Solirubrobacteraceae bacterium]|jgi:hypothetical protein|nr:hypothetical protein [Solirubrobacteraceae bacterium]
MTAALTPTLALRYLAELDPAIAAVAVVGPGDVTLAGDPSLPARLAAGSGGETGLLTARSSAHVVIARVGAGALQALVRHDLEMVARELG